MEGSWTIVNPKWCKYYLKNLQSIFKKTELIEKNILIQQQET